MTGVTPVRHLGRLRLVAVGLNSVIGGGIFILPATVTALVGAAGLAAYVAAGTVVTGVGLALGSLAARHDASGGPYLYVRRAFGPFAGFQVGWLFCLARLTAMANMMNGFAQYLGALAPGAARPLPRAGLVVLCAAAIVATNIVGIRATSRAANLLAVLKVAPLLLLGVAGLFFLRAGSFALTPVRPAAMLRAVLLLIFAFTGFEILTVPAEESHRPRRDVPFALAATIGVVSAVYLLVHTVALGIVPRLGSEPAPLAAAAMRIAGPGGRYGMTMVAALSMAGCALLALVGGSRILYAMASRRQIPAVLGALDPRFRTPVTASLLLGSIATALAIGGGYAELAAVSTGARLLVFLACCLACLRRIDGGSPAVPATHDPGSLGAGGRVVPLLTAAAIAALLPGLERREVIAGMIGIVIGPALYLAARRERRALASEEEGP